MAGGDTPYAIKSNYVGGYYRLTRGPRGGGWATGWSLEGPLAAYHRTKGGAMLCQIETHGGWLCHAYDRADDPDAAIVHHTVDGCTVLEAHGNRHGDVFDSKVAMTTEALSQYDLVICCHGKAAAAKHGLDNIYPSDGLIFVSYHDTEYGMTVNW